MLDGGVVGEVEARPLALGDVFEYLVAVYFDDAPGGEQAVS